MATPKEILYYLSTMEEFSNFKEFVNKIERENQVHLAGIFKIIPLVEWIPRKSNYDIENLNPVQQIFTPVRIGSYVTSSERKLKMALQEYYEMATCSKYECPKNLSHKEMEQNYWKNLKMINPYMAQVLTTPFLIQI